jgi:short-subunit dehydrogenase
MNKTALITGATSGIGAAYAKRLASQGYDLILTGRRQEIIQKLADYLTKEFNVSTKIIIAELSDDFDIQKVIDAIKNTGDLEMLINNAGYTGPFILFAENSLLEIEKMTKVLVTAPMRLIYTAIPGMSKKGRGIIINVASQAAFAPNKKWAIYAASKAFMKSFSESLYLEVKNNGIKVQVVCPGPTDTDIWRSLPEVKLIMSKFKLMSPEIVVDYSLKDLDKNVVVCIPGLHDKFLQMIVKLKPRSSLYKMADKSV